MNNQLTDSPTFDRHALPIARTSTTITSSAVNPAVSTTDTLSAEPTRSQLRIKKMLMSRVVAFRPRGAVRTQGSLVRR